MSYDNRIWSSGPRLLPLLLIPIISIGCGPDREERMLQQFTGTPSMRENLRNLLSLGLEFREGCTDNEIRRLESVLECDLPDEVEALYRHHDGVAFDAVKFDAFRLMSVDQVVGICREKIIDGWMNEEEKKLIDMWRIRFFWTNDNSDWAGVYLDGPLRGRVCYFLHDDAGCLPYCRSIDEFYRKNFEYHARGGYFPYDDRIPVETEPSVSDEQLARDREIVRSLERLTTECTDEDLARLLQECTILVTPVEDTKNLIPYLQVDDMFVPMYAAEVLGKRKHAEAIPHLEKLAVRGKPNGDGAAMDALGEIGTKECWMALHRIAGQIDASEALRVASALEECGVEVERVMVSDEDWYWKYRLPDDSEWHMVGRTSDDL